MLQTINLFHTKSCRTQPGYLWYMWNICIHVHLQKPKVSFSEEEEEEEEEFSEPDTPSSAGIEVVHSKAPPNLHGILKPRSMSESSEDPSSSR